MKGHRGKFVAARRRWVLDLSIDAFGKSILHVLIQYFAEEGGEAWPSIDRLASEGGMSVRKVQTVLSKLEADGLIEITRSPGRRSNSYRLTGSPETLHSPNGAQYAGMNGAQRAGIIQLNPARKVPQPRTVTTPTPHGVRPIDECKNEEHSALSVWDLWDAVTGKKNRSYLGRLIREHGEEEVAKAVAIVSSKRPADPVSYLKGVLGKRSRPTASDRIMSSPL